MNTRQLGNSDLYITPIGFGAWAIGGSGWQFAWGAQDDDASVAANRVQRREILVERNSFRSLSGFPAERNEFVLRDTQRPANRYRVAGP